MERSRGYIEQDRWSGGAGRERRGSNGREAFVSQRSAEAERTAEIAWGAPTGTSRCGSVGWGIVEAGRGPAYCFTGPGFILSLSVANELILGVFERSSWMCEYNHFRLSSKPGVSSVHSQLFQRTSMAPVHIERKKKWSNKRPIKIKHVTMRSTRAHTGQEYSHMVWSQLTKAPYLLWTGWEMPSFAPRM
jgi:hypothetical protein